MKQTAFSLLCLLMVSSFAFSQEKEDSDSLIRLMSARSARLVEIDGKPCRKVEGPARFFHNDTYLLCDTAFWNVDEEYIDAIGNVKIIQENTQLTGDRIHYIINQNLAQFRGTMVELTDKDHNTLRTKDLDYNTKDSIAYFTGGASMKDKDGNIIESRKGRYESKLQLFTFIGRVQMFSDSLFFISDTMKYRSDLETAYFAKNTKGWKDDNYMSSGGGWYNRKNETLYFDRNVYGQTAEYETWSRDLFYDRGNENAVLRGDIQLLDTVNGSIILGNKLNYTNEPRYCEVLENPVFIAVIEENGEKDSLFVVADSLIYRDQRRCDVDSSLVAQARERKELSKVDAIANIQQAMRDKAAQEAARQKKEGQGRVPGKQKSLTDSLSAPADSTGGVSSKADSLMARAGTEALNAEEDTTMVPNDTIDTLAVEVIAPPDTSRVIFLDAYHDVKIFKKDMQGLCDSLVYSGLDSIARLYTLPVLWNEIKNQLVADSMQLVVEDGQLKKGMMISNAFITTHETDIYFNQVKSPEMVGYFTDGQLSRFDALGGASMIFYLMEDTVYTTMNQKECKIISARLKDGNISKNYYYEGVKSDAYPLFNLEKDKQQLKGFNWRGDERPESRFDLTDRIIRPSLRKETLDAPDFPLFPNTSIYFPDYIDQIMTEINSRKPLKWIMPDKGEPDEITSEPVKEAKRPKIKGKNINTK